MSGVTGHSKIRLAEWKQLMTYMNHWNTSRPFINNLLYLKYEFYKWYKDSYEESAVILIISVGRLTLSDRNKWIHFEVDILKCVFVNKDICISIKKFTEIRS